MRNKWCLVFDRSGSMCFVMDNCEPNYIYPPDRYPLNDYRRMPSGYLQSPSPTGSRWHYLCVATSQFLTLLSSSPVENRLGLITFATDATQDCTFSTDYSPITTKLATYGNNQMIGSTDLYDGLSKAVTLFNNSDDGTPWNKIIVVLSDGNWNESSDPVTLIPTLNSKGIVVHTVGLLDGGNNDAMHQLASQTGGKCLLATNAQELQDAFTVLSQTIPVILTK